MRDGWRGNGNKVRVSQTANARNWVDEMRSDEMESSNVPVSEVTTSTRTQYT